MAGEDANLDELENLAGDRANLLGESGSVLIGDFSLVKDRECEKFLDENLEILTFLTYFGFETSAVWRLLSVMKYSKNSSPTES